MSCLCVFARVDDPLAEDVADLEGAAEGRAEGEDRVPRLLAKQQRLLISAIESQSAHGDWWNLRRRDGSILVAAETATSDRFIRMHLTLQCQVLLTDCYCTCLVYSSTVMH